MPLSNPPRINGPGSYVTESSRYGLWCISGYKHLKIERRKRGIKLFWEKDNPLNVWFEKERGSGLLVSGEKIAIRFDGGDGGYLYYKRRPYGINREFGSRPVYEREIRIPGNRDGNSIPVRSPVAIYSVIGKDFMIGCKRLLNVVNLAWLRDCLLGYRVPFGDR